MTVAPSVGQQGPTPLPSPSSLVAQAERLAAGLVERQAETEERTYYAQDTHEEFSRAGFYRILVPRRYGGLELGVETFMRVATALARGCPSTGWMYLFGAAHALAAATVFDERAQSEIFSGGDFICPATVGPNGTAHRAEDGGWILNGTWPYCSGSPYATHLMAHAFVGGDDGNPPSPMLFIAPRDQWRRLDDWGGQLGLKGSGSHSITIENGHIPDHFALPTHLSMLHVSDTPGHRIHSNPEYGGGPLSFMLLELGALAVGMAKGALDTYEELLRTKLTAFLPITARINDPDYQFRYGEASGMIAAAEAAITDAVRQWSETCEQGPAAFTREHELRLAMISREAVRLSWRAVEGHLFPTAGSSSVREGERIERVWRDMSTLHSHAGLAVFLSTLANREYTRVKFDIVD